MDGAGPDNGEHRYLTLFADQAFCNFGWPLSHRPVHPWLLM